MKTIALLALTCLLAAPVQAAPLEIVALGASNTDGCGVGRAVAFPTQLEDMLRARGIDARVHNEGRTGEATWSMLERLDSAVPKGAKIVIFDPARNDFIKGGTIWSWRKNIDKMVARLEARGIKTIVIYPFRDYRDMKQADGIHINAEAHRLLAERLAQEIEAMEAEIG